MKTAQHWFSVVLWIALLVSCQIAGTLWHEVAGHGGVGLLLGGRVDQVAIWGCQLHPRIQWLGWDGRYGFCQVSGITDEASLAWVSLGGSVSTLVVSIVAIALLWVRRWKRAMRTMLFLPGTWWLDLLTYTLPTWGIPRSVFWGGRVAEPYDAAVALGMAGWFFQAGVILISVLLATLLVVRVGQLRRLDRAAFSEPQSADGEAVVTTD